MTGFHDELVARLQYFDGHSDTLGLFADGRFLAHAGGAMADPFRGAGVQKVAGIEARGFVLATGWHSSWAWGSSPSAKQGSIHPGEKVDLAAPPDWRGRSLAEHLSAALNGAEIVHTDDFASWDNTLDWWPELIEQLLVPLSQNRTARFKRSRWTDAERGWVEIQPAAFVILEGVTASRKAFRPYLTYSIWVEAPPELRMRRGLERDGDDARAQWESWMAEEENYRTTEYPREGADFVVRGDRDIWS